MDPVENLCLGVFPGFNVELMRSINAPLVTYLSRELGIPVLLSAPSDYRQFLDQSKSLHYDLVLAPPHQVGYLMSEENFVPLATDNTGTEVKVFAREGSGIHAPRDLRGKTVLIASREGIVILVALAQLKEAGLTEPGDIKLVETGSYAEAIFRFAKGEADAVIVPTIKDLVNPVLMKDLVVISEVGNLPGVAFLVRPGMPEERIDQLKKLFLGIHRHELGRYPFAKSGARRLVPFDEAVKEKFLKYKDLADQ
ncbi:MAG: PhnD/SsuA/transferrin family substrate-binding protein [Deltaproteobacteria bacterium]|nr:PhnD/SsuA/transferrin family substrate-binding protein [Deltaproteobacteria bacterium]